MGPYSLDFEVASGPLGSLWSAHVESGPWKGELVTVRRIEAHALPPEAVDDIAAAALWAMELKDDRLVAVTDIVGDASVLGIVGMRLEGSPLCNVLRAAAAGRQPIPEPIVARFALDVAEQLSVLHSIAPAEPRYVFGGLTPESLFFERDGWTSLIDVGVSAAAARTSVIGRNPDRTCYLAPEQLAGRCDARTDVFSLGLMLWEMLGTRRVYRADSVELLLEKVRVAKIPHLSRLVRPGTGPVPDAVGDVIARALAKNPAERFSTPDELAGSLAQAVEPATHVQAALTLGLLRPSSVRPAPSRRIPLPGGPRRQLDTLPYADDLTVIPSLGALSNDIVDPPVSSSSPSSPSSPSQDALPSYDIDADWDD